MWNIFKCCTVEFKIVKMQSAFLLACMSGLYLWVKWGFILTSCEYNGIQSCPEDVVSAVLCACVCACVRVCLAVVAPLCWVLHKTASFWKNVSDTKCVKSNKTVGGAATVTKASVFHLVYFVGANRSLFRRMLKLQYSLSRSRLLFKCVTLSWRKKFTLQTSVTWRCRPFLITYKNKMPSGKVKRFCSVWSTTGLVQCVDIFFIFLF